MSLTRAEVLSHLQAQFAALTTETGQVTTDTAAGFGSAIDMALRQLGTAQVSLATGTVATGDEVDGLQLAEYFALRRFARDLAIRVDISLDAPTASRRESQAYAQVKGLLDELKGELESRGFLKATWSLGSLNLDFLESAAG